LPECKTKYFQILSLKKGLKIIELLAEKRELSVTDVARSLDLNRSGSHRYLATLQEAGYVEKNGEGRYQITFKVLELGMKVANRFKIKPMARPFMEKLVALFHETVNLGYWTHGEVVHLDKIDSGDILRIDLGVGQRAPAYCTALGKSILAFLPPNESEAYLQSVKFDRLTPNTITSRKRFVQELEGIRKKGFAIDDEELFLGLRCVGAPVFDFKGYPQYSLSVAGPTFRMTRGRIKKIERGVREIARAFSAQMRGLNAVQG
jgi:DNA-binding IclR family transcriptional regulator